MKDDLEELADAAVRIIGEPEPPYVRVGNWLFGGTVLAALLQGVGHVGPGWIVAAGLLAGWAGNEWQRRKGKK